MHVLRGLAQTEVKGYCREKRGKIPLAQALPLAKNPHSISVFYERANFPTRGKNLEAPLEQFHAN
jgi:hypothetical protein